MGLNKSRKVWLPGLEFSAVTCLGSRGPAPVVDDVCYHPWLADTALGRAREVARVAAARARAAVKGAGHSPDELRRLQGALGELVQPTTMRLLPREERSAVVWLLASFVHKRRRALEGSGELIQKVWEAYYLGHLDLHAGVTPSLLLEDEDFFLRESERFLLSEIGSDGSSIDHPFLEAVFSHFELPRRLFDWLLRLYRLSNCDEGLLRVLRAVFARAPDPAQLLPARAAPVVLALQQRADLGLLLSACQDLRTSDQEAFGVVLLLLPEAVVPVLRHSALVGARLHLDALGMEFGIGEV